MKLHEKYYYLPQKYWKKHDLCEYLISQIEEFITNDIYNGLKFRVIELKSLNELLKNEHPLDFLLRTGKKEIHDEMITNQISLGLIIDICYFIQEALACSKKKRLVVAFSLLRKPFVFDLIVLLRLIFEDHFLEKFNDQEDFDTTGLSKEDKIFLLKESTKLMLIKSITEVELFEFIFDTTNPNSIINLSNKALHPSTTKYPDNKTGKQNLNFMFSNFEDIERYWDYIYSVLPMLLIYYVEIVEIFVFASLKLDTQIHIKRVEERAKRLIEYTGIKI